MARTKNAENSSKHRRRLYSYIRKECSTRQRCLMECIIFNRLVRVPVGWKITRIICIGMLGFYQMDRNLTYFRNIRSYFYNRSLVITCIINSTLSNRTSNRSYVLHDQSNTLRFIVSLNKYDSTAFPVPF